MSLILKSVDNKPNTRDAGARHASPLHLVGIETQCKINAARRIVTSKFAGLTAKAVVGEGSRSVLLSRFLRSLSARPTRITSGRVVEAFLFLSLSLSSAFAQTGASAGLIRTQGTIAAGKAVNVEGIKPYIYGELEAMPDDHIGIAGSILVDFAKRNYVSPEPTSVLPNYSTDWTTHHLFFGPNYHFLPNQAFDVFVGAQPGITLVQGHNHFSNTEFNSIAPSGAITGGVAYYGSFFHLFGQAKFMSGYIANREVETSLTEVMLSLGLGFNINVKSLK